MTYRGRYSLVLCALLFIALALPACSSDDAENGEPSEPEVFEDPNPGLPSFQDDPFAWGEANAGLPMPFEGNHLVAMGGDAYLYVKALNEKVEGEDQSEIGELSGVYRMDGETFEWSRIAGKPTGYGLRSMVAGPDGSLYAHRESGLYRLDGDTWVELSSAPDKFGTLVAQPGFDDGALFGLFDDDRGLYRYDIATDEWTTLYDGGAAADSAGVPGKHPHDSWAFAADGTLYVSRKWAIRDSEGETGCVFAFDGANWSDMTLNLRETSDSGMPIHMLNATGNGWGPFGRILLHPDGTDLIGTSEQGAFRMMATENRWEPMAAIWYGARVHVAGPYIVVGKERLEVHLDEFRRMSVGSYDIISGRELQEVVSPRDELLVSRFRRRTEYKGERYEYQTIVVTEFDPDAQVSSLNIDLDFAGYVGTDGHDTMGEVAWDADGETLYAVWNEGAGEDTRGNGVLSIRDATGAETSRIDLPSAVGDAAAAPDGGVWVATRNAVLRFGPDGGEATTSIALPDTGGERRVAVAKDGRLGIVAGKSVMLAEPTGEVVHSTELVRAYVEDIAISSDDGLIYVVGFDNQNNGNPVQVPFLVAHGFDDFEQRWKVWGNDPSTLDNDMADSRLYRVVLGRNGDLYVAGEVAGGNTLFRWNGQDLETNTLVTYDPYNHATNTASEHKGYLAQLDAATGEVRRGIMVIARLSNGRGNTWKPRGLDVAEDGRVWLTGVSSARFAGRDLQHVNGQPVGPYAGGDPSLLVLSPDFRQRLRWTTFVEKDAGGFLRSVAVGPNKVALGTTADKGDLFVTDESGPINPAADDDLSDVWLAVYPKE